MIHSATRLRDFSYAIRNIVTAAESLEQQGRHVTYLNIGDPQAFGFRPPDHIVEVVQRALSQRFTGYAHSTGLPEAREAISTYATSIGARTSPEDVILSSGASEAADLVLTALLDPDDEVLLPAPGYPIYPAILSKLGATARYYKLDTNTWRPSVDELPSLINSRTKAIVLINPNNPTGSITPDETTLGLLSLAAEHDLLVISDEVYRELCYVQPPTSASVFAAQMGVPVITLESLSKTHLIPGWRVGWMRFTQADKMRELIGAITRLASGRLCSATPTQYAVKPALEGQREFLHDFVRETRARRDLAISKVASVDGLSCSTPEAAFYLLVRIEDTGGRSDEELVLEMLKSTGVLAVHGSGFGCDPRDGFFRIVFLAQKEILAGAFDAIGRFVAADDAD